MSNAQGPEGWVGFDLDGTIAVYTEWYGIDHIGEPVPAMIKLMQQYITAGVTLKIFTARVTHPEYDPRGWCAIEDWCQKYLGVVLEITNVKDFYCRYVYDDRARQVEFNTGRIIGDKR